MSSPTDAYAIRRVATGLALLALAVTAFRVWQPNGDASAMRDANANVPLAATAPAPVDRLRPGATSLAIQPPDEAREATTRDSLATRIDRLARSASPVDAYNAYKLVRTCLQARLRSQAGAADADVAAACEDIASDQVQARLAWLERAARAGVRHAATDFAAEGPQGLLVPRDAQGDWEDASEWQERVAAYDDAGARRCDDVSVLSVQARYRLRHFDPDPAAALTTWAAAAECVALGKAPMQPPDSRDVAILAQLRAQLGAAEADAAVSAGEEAARRAPPFGAP